MKMILYFALICFFSSHNGFAVTILVVEALSQSASSRGNHARPTNLVDQSLFIAAVERIEDEIALQHQQVEQEEAHQAELEEVAREEGSTTFSDPVYAIGRLFVDLPIDTQPELDLTESIGPLVLVTDVWGRTAELSGLQPFDTITRVTVGGGSNQASDMMISSSDTGEIPTTGDGNRITRPASPSSASTTTMSSQTTFAASCRQSTLEETAAILTAAAQHALQMGQTTIQLEVNRLLPGYYYHSNNNNDGVEVKVK